MKKLNLAQLMQEVGLANLLQGPAQFKLRDMRIVGEKPLT